MSIAKTIILKSNMNCNLRCKYCYEFKRNGDIYNSDKLDEKQLCNYIERVAAVCPNSRILWMLHGGEPLINGLDYFESFVDCIRKMNEQYDVEFKIALQTNVTLLTDQWVKMLEKNLDLLSERIVSVSIDGPQRINDMARVTPNGASSYQMTMDAINRIKNSQLVFTTISVVGEHNVKEPDEVYRFIRHLNPNLCKFIPCYNYDSSGKTELMGITPLEYAEFMCRIFDLWMHDLPGQKEWFVIEPIASIISKLTNTFVTWCEYREEKCDNFICLYPDGEMWLCDTFDHDTMRENAFVGNIYDITDDKLKRILETPCSCCKYETFYSDMTEQCMNCDIYTECRGGCIANRMDMKRKSSRLFQEYCEAKHLLIGHIREGVEHALS